jgi:ubiquinone/menaquinone biosynthesis C-methylase UbiE
VPAQAATRCRSPDPPRRVYCVEPCLPMLDVARERATAEGLHNIEFIHAEAQRLLLPDDSVHIVFAHTH